MFLVRIMIRAHAVLTRRHQTDESKRAVQGTLAPHSAAWRQDETALFVSVLPQGCDTGELPFDAPLAAAETLIRAIVGPTLRHLDLPNFNDPPEIEKQTKHLAAILVRGPRETIRLRRNQVGKRMRSMIYMIFSSLQGILS